MAIAAKKDNQIDKAAQLFAVCWAFVKKNAVTFIALLAAAITMIFVPPDSEYLSYFDFKTLTCLFCTLLVICALKNIRLFNHHRVPCDTLRIRFDFDSFGDSALAVHG